MYIETSNSKKKSIPIAFLVDSRERERAREEKEGQRDEILMTTNQSK